MDSLFWVWNKMPYPSLTLVLLAFYLKATWQPIQFSIYLFSALLLTFLALSSLIVCIVRDPGKPPNEVEDSPEQRQLSLQDALASSPFQPKHWCNKCDAPKPERTHHCSFCGRCVLKMDHHCPWLANKCVVSSTFLHIYMTCQLTFRSGLQDISIVFALSYLHHAFSSLLFGNICNVALLIHIQSIWHCASPSKFYNCRQNASNHLVEWKCHISCAILGYRRRCFCCLHWIFPRLSCLSRYH